MTIGIKVLGVADSVIGYSASLRDHVRALVENGVEVYLPAGKSKYEMVELDAWWKENLPKLQAEKPYQFILCYCSADFYTTEKDKYSIGFTPWEVTRISKDNVEKMNKVDEVWSTSSFCTDVFRKCGVTKPMSAFSWPLGDKWTGHNGSKALDFGDQFVFFSSGTLDERKNQSDLITAYCAEFQGEGVTAKGVKTPRGTTLVLKTFIMTHSPLELKKVRDTIKDMKSNLSLSKDLQINLITKNIPDTELPSWFNVADCYVCPSRGEGMGGPAIQCMALGKPLISTDFSAMADYHQTPWKVDYTMFPVQRMNWAYGYPNSDAEWARLDIASLRKCMREAYEMWKNDQPAWQTLCAKQREFIMGNFNYAKVGGAMKARLEEIAATLPVNPKK
jgi:glycosyltransferase involved in cell wall biosynthesis